MIENTSKQQILPLKEGYYLDNFQILLNYVQDKYSDLLNNDELRFINEFNKLSEDARRLYVRLIMRKGPYFRKDKIKYPEINDIEFGLNELCKTEFFKINPRENIEFALNTITKPELEQIIAEHKGVLEDPRQKIKSKEDILDYLLIQDENTLWLILERLFTFYTPNYYEFIFIFKLLFFGNTYQDLSEFILEDIGILTFEKYDIREEDRYFSERDIIDETILISQLRTELYLSLQSNDLDNVLMIGDLLKKYGSHTKVMRKKEKSFFEIGRFLEKFTLWDKAIVYYNLSGTPGAKERIIRVLDKKGLLKKSLEESNKILSDSDNVELTEFAKSFSENLKRKIGLPYKKRQKETFNTEEILLKQCYELRIEEITLNHYKSIGFEGFYTENGIWKALFALTFWDIIFMPVPEVFFNPFQRGPTDLFSPGFRSKRIKSFEKRLQEINKKTWAEKILELYDLKFNTACHLMPWKKVEKKQLESLLKVVPALSIINILDRMSHNLKDFKTGFPDLFIFDLDKRYYNLIEVKGPGDQLRPNQKRWLRYFGKHNIPYKVANIKWK